MRASRTALRAGASRPDEGLHTALAIVATSALLTLVVTVSLAGPEPPRAAPASIQETTLLNLKKFGPSSACLSADGRHIALLVLNHKTSFWEKLIPPQPTWIIGQSGRKTFHPQSYLFADVSYGAFVDDLPFGQYSLICPKCLALSPDGRHVACAVSTDSLPPKGAQYGVPCRKWCMVLDGEPQEPHDDVGGPVFSPDGEHMAYLAVDGFACVLVLDGVPGPSLGSNGAPEITFSPDGRQVAYVARSVGGAVVVVDGTPGPMFADVDALSLRFSPDGSRLAYVATLDSATKSEAAVIDGRQGPVCDTILPAWVNPGAGQSPGRDDVLSGITFSSDSRHVSYAGVSGTRHFVVQDGTPGPTFDGVVPPCYVGADTIATYAAKQAGQWFLVAAGRPDTARYDEVQYNPALRPEAGHWAYAVREGGKNTMIVDGRRGPSVDRLRVMDMRFSPDGGRCAYPAADGKEEFVILDGRPGPHWDEVFGIAFSPDGRHMAYCVRDEGKCFAMLDGLAGPSYDGIPKGGGTFDPNGGALEYIAMRGNTVYRIRHEVPSPPPSP